MEVFSKIAEIQEFLDSKRKSNKSIGFVPTMGSLHAAHQSLVQCSTRENNITVVSIFVNPLQFNDKSDFERYPRDLDADFSLLSLSACNVVFVPSEKELFPENQKSDYDLGELDLTMEGKYRPGHFQGVATVVHRLFDIIRPDKAYFGMKDFQQLTIIRHVTKQLSLPVEVVACPTLRESSGLAYSSRNKRLDENQIARASVIYKTISAIPSLKTKKSLADIKKWVKKTINETEGLELEYVEIVKKETLKPISEGDYKNSICCVSVYCGNVRLIDNFEI